MTRFVFVCFCVISLTLHGQYDARKFGAVGDGKNLDTRFIQAAIDSAHHNNGGVVNISAGTYKIGTLILKSNVELHLMMGAILIASTDLADYGVVKQKYESRSRDLYAKHFMIFAEKESNISITGLGTIDGNGLKNFQEERPQNLRPFMIRLVDCSHVTISDVRLMEAANWTLHLLACMDVNVTGVTITATAEGNRDGIDIDACQRVTVSNCRISTTDDAIVMKATSDDICRDITINNCFLSSKGSAIKTGTESNGGFKNITVSNCVIKDIPVHAGIELMTVDGGAMENILVQNIAMENVATPLFIHLGIRARPYKARQYVQKIGNVSGMAINNITVVNAKLPSSIIGLKHKRLANISVSDYTVRYSDTQKPVGYNEVPALEFEYPAANMYRNLPAFGLYCRDVEGLYLQNIKIFAAPGNETRAACVFDRVDHLRLMSLEAETGNRLSPLAYLRNSKHILAAYCKSIHSSKNLFEIEGNSVSDVKFVDNLLQPSQVNSTKVAILPDIKNIDSLETQELVLKDSPVRKNGVYELKNGCCSFPVRMKKGSVQVCLLVVNASAEPRKLIIKYQGIQQEFTVDWSELGWAPFSLLKQFSEREMVDFSIEDAEPQSPLKIARMYIRPLDIEYTD